MKNLIFNKYVLIMLSIFILGSVRASTCDTVCTNTSTKMYTVSGILDANTYTWSVSGGISIVSGQGNDAVFLDFTNATLGTQTISCVVSNGCGFMAPAIQTVVVTTECLVNLQDLDTVTSVNRPIVLGPAVIPGPDVTIDTSTANNGTVTLNPDGTITYTPDPNFVGTDTVVRIVCKTVGGSTGCDTQQLIINVTPEYGDTTVLTGPGVTVGPVGTPISVMPGSDTTVTTMGPSNGTVTVNPDGTVTYTPNPGFVGIDTVERIVCVTFTDGGVDCNTSLMIFVVRASTPDTTATTPMNTPVGPIGPAASGPNVNVTATASNGTATVNADGTITYTPNLGFVGNDTVPKIICVTNGGTTSCDTSYIYITVTPTYPDTLAITRSGVPVSVGPAIPVGPNVTVTTEGPSNGTVTLNADGTLTYKPNPNFVGMDTVIRIVCVTSANGVETCDTSMAIFRVGPVSSGSETTPINTPVVAGNAIVAGPNTTISQTVSASNGTVTVNADGTLAYTPNTDYLGPDTITRIVCVTYVDSSINCDTFYIPVTVTGILPEVQLPNYFSPNGDGSNDAWIIPESIRTRITNLNIYNRWGNIVWGNKGLYNNDFTGIHFEGNHPLPDGVYYYFIELRDEKDPTSGFIEIMRK